MAYLRINLLITLLLTSFLSFGQKVSEGHFEEIVTYLANDKLEGRLTGSKGCQMAAEFIRTKMKEYGIKPAVDNYYQPFSFLIPPKLEGENFMKLGSKVYEFSGSVYPAVISGNGQVEGQIVDVGRGIYSKEANVNDYKGKGNLQGKILLIDLSFPEDASPHSPIWKLKGWKFRLDIAEGHNPAAIIFYNYDPILSLRAGKGFTNIFSEDIPIVLAENDLVEEIKKNPNKKAEIKVNIVKEQKKTNNVVGEIDNGKDEYIVLGAHYDHLGYGQYGNSRYLGKEPKIHNGADDNASGVAMILELGRMLKESDLKDYNYLILAFSGEELGLLGSHFFTDSPFVQLNKINCMLNFDMVGRLNDSTHQLGLNGVKTAAEWDKIIKDINQDSTFDIKTTPSGMGASDQTSFYLKDIPVIHFFTGTHEDYHKPSDDVDKINFDGMVSVANFTFNMLKEIDHSKPLTFHEVTDTSGNREVPRFKVTLGIMPDYFYKEKGVRIDGISPGKTADKAGLEKGDVIVKLGDIEVNDLYSYMNALSQFSDGDETNVEYMRDGVKKKAKVKFQ